MITPTKRRIAVAAGILVVASVVAVTVANATRADAADCTIQRLPVPSGGGHSIVLAMDRTGRHVAGRVWSKESGEKLDLVLWADGTTHRAELPGESQVPEGVSSSGVVVGTTTVVSDIGKMNLRAWMYRDGAVTVLSGGTSAEAHAVSDDGIVVGTVDNHPVMWRSPSEAPSLLPVPGKEWEGEARGISADGTTIVGTLNLKGAGRNRPYVWMAGGAPRDLPLPVVDGEPVLGALATAITGDWIAGTAMLHSGRDGVPTRWNLRTGQAQAFPKYRISQQSISTDGWMTAYRKGAGLILLLDGRATAVLRGYGSARDTSEGISMDGRTIAGNASQNVPILWHCA